MGRYLWLWFLGAGSLLALTEAYADLDGDRWVITAMVLAGVTAAALVSARARFPRGSWIIYLGVLGPAVGFLAGVADEVSSSQALALGLWIVSYVVTFSWMSAVIVVRSPGRDWAAVIDTLVVMLVIGMLAWEFFIAPALVSSGLDTVVRLRNVVDPVMDLLLLLLFVRLLLQSPVRSVPLVLSLVAAGILVVADGVRLMLVIDGLHDPDGPLGAARILVWTLWGTATLHPDARKLTELARLGSGRLTLSRFTSLVVAALAAPAIMVVQSMRGAASNPPVLLGGCILVFLLILVRIWQMAKELEGKVAEGDDLSRKLAHQAFHDPLTGLANRAGFNDELERVLRDGDPAGLMVMLIDLDDFKRVNDTLGHGAGDELLIEVARRLSTSVPPGGLVARLGGDEFVVLLEAAEPGSAGAAAAWALAVLGEPMTLDDVPYRVGASVGVAVGRAGDDRAGLLRRADLAMYAAKARGKSTYEVYQPWMADRAPGFLPTVLPSPDRS